MAEQTKIAWCDHTWSPWRGCSHAALADGSEHPGCLNCYAEALSKRNTRVLGMWGVDGTRVVNANWKTVLKWDRLAGEARVRRRVFTSLCDPFEEAVGWVLRTNGDVMIEDDQVPGGRCRELPDVRREFFRLIDSTPNLDWLLLTKRPQNVRSMWPFDRVGRRAIFPGCHGKLGEPQDCYERLRRNNVWLGVSVSDQRTADELIPELLKLRDLSPVLFVSIEPMLGLVRLNLATECDRNCAEHQEAFCPGTSGKCVGQQDLDLVIVGGESGPSARPCDVSWIRSIVAQCKATGTPCFVKQLGSHVLASEALDPVDQFPGDVKFDGIDRTTIRARLRDRKGGDPSEWPEDLQVQEMPHVR
jgi:protein gp37